MKFPEDIKERVKNGQALWDEIPVDEDEENDDAEVDDDDDKKDKGPTEDEKMLMTMFGEGMYHIVPAFYRMLIYLRKERRSFKILFRTFGTDLEKITWEFNSFCEGSHPCFNGSNNTPFIKFNGTDGTQDFRITKPEQQGLYYRFSNDIQDSKLVTGTFTRKAIEFNDLQD